MSASASLRHDHPELAIYGVEEVPRPRTLVDILSETVENHPQELALESVNESLTYRQLGDRIDAQVKRLHECGVGRGDRVGIRVPSGTTDLYVAILSTIAAGAAYVPVDWDDPDSRAETVWEESGVAAVYGEGLAITMRDSAAERVADTTPPGLEDDAWIIFTSGSTGKPKGVAITHRSAAALVDAEQRMYLVNDPLKPGDRVMAGLSVAFDASCEEMWLAWRTGAALIAAHRDVVRSGDSLGDWIAQHRITAISTVPTLAAFWPEESLANIRLLIFGGEACPLDLVQRLTVDGREVWNTYGPTEATVICSGELLDGEAPIRIGRPTPGWELVVVDDQGEPVAWGETGQLIAGGVGLGRYLDPLKDAEMYAPLDSMGWERAYRTGDLVVADRAGLIFAGRGDDQIKFGGRRLELGEIDEKLTGVSGVRVGASRLNKTDSGSDVLVGYLVAEDGVALDLVQVRKELSETMPGGIVPVLCVLDDMPIKTSGKVDRKTLPWPLPRNSALDDAPEVPAELAWLAEKWASQLGPIPLTGDSSFFDLGGSSVAVAKLAADLRKTHPTVEIGELYAHPTLAEMNAYVSSLGGGGIRRPEPAPMSPATGFLQGLWILVLTCITAVRYGVSALIVVWFLSVVFEAGWVPRPPVVPLAVAWFFTYTPMGRMLITAGMARLLTVAITPGHYERGGWTHLRIWAADRLFHHMNLEAVEGSPLAPQFYRLLGARVGENARLGVLPPVTGMISIGDNVTIEDEVDLAGYWIDGDTVIVGDVTIGNNVRIGCRGSVAPGTWIGDNVELLAGSHADGLVRSNGQYNGSPLVAVGAPGESFPNEDPGEHFDLGRVNASTNYWLYLLAMAVSAVLPIISAGIGTVVLATVTGILRSTEYNGVFLTLVLWAPVFLVIYFAVWLGLVSLVIRALSGVIKPGYYPESSVTDVALWLTRLLMRQTLENTYFLYASNLTPALLRFFGAKVGKDAEISTVVTIPHLTTIQGGAFLADDAMINAPRHGFGWTHVGTTVVCEKSFVGNSAIVGADQDMPEDSLLAVVSSATPYAEAGSSWMGRQSRQIPRVKVVGSDESTFRPNSVIKTTRFFIEALRLIPVLLTFLIDVAIVWAATAVYVESGMNTDSLLRAGLALPLIVLVGYTVSSYTPVLAKWLLVGRFSPGERQLHSSFVWRNELVDNFTELMAVPTMVYISLGSPWFNIWARAMGARVGRSAWVETWWLPEFDLIDIGDRVTINRGTVIQTHLFHDRVMSLHPVRLAAGSTLGPDSFVLPGAEIGERTTIGPGSLILRGDVIPSDGYWRGNPVSPVTDSVKHTPLYSIPAGDTGVIDSAERPAPSSRATVLVGASDPFSSN